MMGLPKRKAYIMSFKRLLFYAAVIFLVLFVIIGDGKRYILKWQYPIKYKEIVTKYAGENGLDAYLIYAVIKTESGYDPSAVSSAGAKGLMQLMDATAVEIAAKKGIPFDPSTDLFDPEKNIMFGTFYLRELLDEYGDMDLTITAYNGGRGNVDRWLRESEFSDGEGGLKEIPFKETDTYVKKVNRAYRIYQYVYVENVRY